MPRKVPTQSRVLNMIFQQAAEKERVSDSQTPLIAIVVASFLDRLGFVEFINSVITWDQSQWRVSPGNLAKSILLLPFIYPGPRLPICSIFEHYQQMDMSLLFTSEVHAEWLTRVQSPVCWTDFSPPVVRTSSLRLHSGFILNFPSRFIRLFTGILLPLR